jgi:PAS domain S-box-containing protein
MGDDPTVDISRAIQQLEAERSKLEAVLRQLPLAVVIAEAPSGRMILGNEQVERILLHPFVAAENVDGYRVYRGIHQDGTLLDPDEWPLARALAHGETTREREIDVIRGDGSRGTIRVNAAPIREADDSISAAVAVFEDVTRRKRHESSLAFLSRASEIVAVSLDYETTLASIADLIVPYLADWCVVDLLSDSGNLRRLAMKHADPDQSPLLDELAVRYPMSVDHAVDPMTVVETGQPSFHPVVSLDEIERAACDEGHLTLLRQLGIASYLCVPLIARGQTLGAISLVHSRSGRRYDSDDLALAEELARRVAIAIDNARLFADERASRSRAEEGLKRLSFLANASRILSVSLDYDATLNELAHAVVPDIADLCIIDVIDAEGRLYRPAVAYVHPAEEQAFREVMNRASRSLDDGVPTSNVLRNGTPVILKQVAENMIGHAASEEDAAIINAAGFRSALILPIARHGTMLGAMSLVSTSPNFYDESDLPFFTDLAGRAAISMENARLYHQSQISEARYRSLIEHAADTILVADDEGRYLDANPAATDLLGYSREELLTMRVADITERGPDWTESEYERFKAQGIWTGELDLRHRNGSIIPVEATATVATVGDASLYLSVIRDISHRRANEMMQREFMTIVTHDLKSPLTSIKGFAQLMQRRETYSPGAVNAIVDQAQLLERLINDLLDAARLEVGRSELRRTEVDLVALVHSAAKYSQALTRNHTVRVEQETERLTGLWDYDRIIQVTQNLLTNAINYSPEGGEIVVTVGVTPERGSREAFVTVRDSGVGINRNAIKHVFERFYRYDEHHASKGLGLGLYISRSLIEAHGGSISVDSEPGIGSTFRFTLPIDTA